MTGTDNVQQLALFQPRTIYTSRLRQRHIVALTFDDGPNSHTPTVLAALRRFHIKATFFIVGDKAHRYLGILQAIARDGHLLGNHSATHPVLSSAYDERPQLLLDQLRDVQVQIAPLMRPQDKLYFRAPYGYWKAAHAKILNADPVLRNYVGPVFGTKAARILCRATAM